MESAQGQILYSDEEKPFLQRETSSASNVYKILYILCGVSICLFTVGSITFTAAIAGVGSYAFDTMFLVDAAHTLCPRSIGNATTEPKSKNNPSHFYNPARCPFVSNVTLEKYWFPDDAWEVVNFMSRDPDWIAEGGGKLEGYLFLQPNDTENRPFTIGVHGYKACKRNYAELFMANVLWRNGYNVMMLDIRNHGNSDANPKAPYATFGSEEHKDVLGALDYLTQRFPKVATADVGLFGCSMGGANVLVSITKDSRFKAAWADSPACDVLGTFQFNSDRITKGAGSLVMSLAATMSTVRSPYGFPPFRNDPLQLMQGLDASKHIFFMHGTQDIVVPVDSSYKCIEAIKNSPAAKNIETFFNVTYHEPVRKEDEVPGACDGHCQMMLVYPEEYSARLVAFFDRALKPKNT